MDKLYGEIGRIAGGYSVEKIVLFGSRARGDNAPKSDIDVAAVISERIMNSYVFLLESLLDKLSKNVG